LQEEGEGDKKLTVQKLRFYFTLKNLTFEKKCSHLSSEKKSAVVWKGKYGS
jgi:hypothetical protein